MSKKWTILLIMVLLCCSPMSAQWIVQQSNFPEGVSVFCITAINEQVVWASGIKSLNGGIMPCDWFCRTVDGGNSWAASRIPIPVNHFITSITAISQDVAWISTGGFENLEKTGVYKTIDGGETWTQQTDGLPTNLTGPNFVHFFDANDGVTVIDPENGYMAIFTSNDGGSNWERLSDSNNVPLLPGEYASMNMYCVAGDAIFWGAAYGSSGRLFKSIDRGKTWSATRTEFTSHPGIHIWPAFQDSLNGMVVAQYDKLYGMANTNDGGTNWFPITSPQDSACQPRYIPGTVGGYLVTGFGSAFTLDRGATWTKIDDIHRFTPAFASREMGWAAAINNSNIYKWFIGQQAIIKSYPLAEIKFSQCQVGLRSKPQDLSITNYGQDPLVISDIVLSGPNFQPGKTFGLPKTLHSLETTRMDVFFTPTAGEILRDSVVVVSNAANSPRYAIKLEGEGIAIEKVQTDSLYAASMNKLYTIDHTTAQATLVSPISLTKAVQGIVINPASQELIGVYATTAATELYSISPNNGKTVLLQTIQVGNMRALAFKSDTLYGATNSGSLYRIDLSTGSTTLIGSAPLVKYYGLAVHPVTGQLYASIASTSGTVKDRIVTINTTNGDTTLVGATGDNVIIPSITFSPSGVLYGLKAATNSPIITIDLKNGAGTPVGSAGVTSLQGLAWAPNSTAVDDQQQADALPAKATLLQNYPNPFNNQTIISFSLPHDAHVTIKIYDIIGRELGIAANDKFTAGIHKIRFNANTLSNGVYLYRINADQFTDTKKFVIIK